MENFKPEAYAAFEEAALEKYDFQTCQRSDGSYYGTGGTCRKGSPVKGKAPDKKEKKSTKDLFAKHNAMAKREEAKIRKKYANKKPDGGLTEAQVRAGGGRLD